MSSFHVDDESSFRDWRRYAGYSLTDCEQTFQVHPRTVINWELGKTRPPRAVFLCLMIFAGRLDFLGKDWKGFRLAPDGCLESPEGDFVWWYEVRAIKYLYEASDLERGRMLKALNYGG